MDTLAVTVNGERREAPAGATVQSLLESLGLDPANVVVGQRLQPQQQTAR